MDARENRRITMTKRLIQEGLLRLLEKKELAAINVTELCREADVNRATFYKYYGSPNDVLAAIKEQFFQELLDSQQQEGANSSTTYTEALGRIFIYLYEHKKLAQHIARNIDFDISALLTKLSHGRNGMDEYLNRNFDGDDVRFARTFLGYGCYSIVRLWLVEEIERTPKQMEVIVQKLLNNDLFR